MLTSQLHILLNISALCWLIFTRCLKQGFFWWDDQNEGQKPYANFKTACFVEYLASMLMDFHETSITGILLMSLSKMSCIWKTFCIILCLLHSILTHTHTYIQTCMYVHVSHNYLFVPNVVLMFHQMYPHPLGRDYFGSGWHLVRSWSKGQVDILLDSQPASQLQLASQPAMWQNVNLSDFGLVR